MTREGGFNATWQRHVAAYVLIEPFLGPGRVLDLGCGVGHSFHRLAPRETVGVDIDAGALEGQERETIQADMRNLPFDDAAFASVVSVQSVEHVPDPERVVAEVARVLEPAGVAVFVTPNRLTLGRPDEIIDPYHFVEFDPRELEQLCAGAFGQVEVRGLFGSERYLELFGEERVTMNKLLRLDPLRLRRLVPRRARQSPLRPHAAPLPPDRGPALGGDHHGRLRASRPRPGRVHGRGGHLPLAAGVGPPIVSAQATDVERRVSSCAWCGRPLGDGAIRLKGRTRCAAVRRGHDRPLALGGRAPGGLRHLVPARVRALQLHR